MKQNLSEHITQLVASDNLEKALDALARIIHVEKKGS